MSQSKFLTKIFLLSSVFVVMILSICFLIYQNEKVQGQFANKINVAGLQRMYSQRAALLANELKLSSKSDALEIKQKLERTINEFSQSHEDLINGNKNRRLSPIKLDSIKRIYFNEPDSLNSLIQQYIQKLNTVSESPTILDIEDNLIYINAFSGNQVLPLLNDVVF